LIQTNNFNSYKIIALTLDNYDRSHNIALKKILHSIKCAKYSRENSGASVITYHCGPHLAAELLFVIGV
jgi:hypothetical protein